ncbi:LacI family DNA-binding transcriptional regulator [Geminisphaera colitermitum]|uniref:LacI family DNA-binding transcriptional regulator n=1 Tax=Geminisphaera colitermitum TaxID=1148786 RepID=UPI0006933D89|nr:LacI family DNA-binding transcriptional regulator [Geminisphaera colitermitum]
MPSSGGCDVLAGIVIRRSRRISRTPALIGPAANGAAGNRSTDNGRVTGIRELAAALGLSVSTVSRAMNNRYGVDAETRERVVAAAREIGYVPDAAARRLKSHPRLRVEVLFSPYHGPNDEINPAALATLQALRERAAARSIALAVRELTDTQPPAEVAADLATHVAEQAFDVAITYGHFHDETLAVLRDSHLPVVCLQSQARSLRQIGVTVDTATAAYQATQYLAALGHMRVALVAGAVASLHHRGYHEGFAAAAAEFGLVSPEAWRLSLPPAELNEAGATAALAPLLAAKASARPTAIVFASDWLAMGGLRAAQTAGLTVPGEVSLIGFDNVAAAAALTPPLTTFDVHHDAMADAVLDAATELLENPNAPATPEQAARMVRADLVKRASCARWGR